MVERNLPHRLEVVEALGEDLAVPEHAVAGAETASGGEGHELVPARVHLGRNRRPERHPGGDDCRAVRKDRCRIGHEPLVWRLLGGRPPRRWRPPRRSAPLNIGPSGGAGGPRPRGAGAAPRPRRRAPRGPGAPSGRRARRRARRAASSRSEPPSLAVAAGLRDEAPLDQAGGGRVGGDSSDPRDLGPRHRPEVATTASVSSDACVRPRCTGRSTSRAQASAASRAARKAYRPRRAPAPRRSGPRGSGPGDEAERGLDPLLLFGHGRQLRDGQRLTRSRAAPRPSARASRPGSLRGGGVPYRDRLEGARLSDPRFVPLRSSSRARKATICSTRVRRSISLSNAKRPREASSERKRSRKRESGG